jgi:hypothetical protein
MVAIAVRVRPREERLPYGEVESLRRPRIRATALRAVLAIGLIVTFLAALGVAISRDARPNAVLPSGTSGMIVLDLSGSTGAKAEVGELIRRIAAADERTGLVVFSDGAYEVLPPGTPGRDLVPMIRFFAPGADGEPIQDPWTVNFAGGTNVLAGIERALTSLEQADVSAGSVLLVSDLEFVPEQIARLPGVLAKLEETSVDVRILPTDARPEQRRFFERVLGDKVFVDIDSATAIATGSAAQRNLFRLSEDGTPWLFALLIGALLMLVAANERYSARLVLPAPEGGSR